MQYFYFGAGVLLPIIVVLIQHTLSIKRLSKGMVSGAKLVIEIVEVHNKNTYNFSKYIAEELQLKSKEKALTEDEKELFYQARQTINEYENQCKKRMTR